MNTRISLNTADSLERYAQIPLAFSTSSIFEVVLPQAGLQGISLQEHRLPQPFSKNYDSLDGGPLGWPERFDVSAWRFLLAEQGPELCGAATVICQQPELQMLEGRADLAVLWDIRVATPFQRQGIGQQLFQAAAHWASERGCKQLKIETQNNNPAACHFYLQMGSELGAIQRFAYPELPDEVQLLWYKQLEPADG